MRSAPRASLALCLLAACSDPVVSRDAGHPDAGGWEDVYVAPKPDVGVVEKPDTGIVDTGGDAGFLDPLTIHEGDQDLEGLRTFMHVRGTTTSTMPPLFVFHAGPGLSHDYLVPFVDEIVRGRTIVYYDMRAAGRSGFGDLSPTSTITASQHARDVLRVVDHTRKWVNTDKVDLIGHGYGGGIAALFAAAHPERVRKLAIVAPYPATIDQWVTARGEFERRMTSSQRELWQTILNNPSCFRDDSRCFLQIYDIVGPNTMCRENQDHWRDMTFTSGSYRGLWYVETELRNSRYDWTREFGKIAAKTSILSGECDTPPLVTSESYAAIAGARHVRISTAGAFPMVEDHAAWHEFLIDTFVEP